MIFLILGSEGYIGRALSANLRENGHEVYGVDNLSRMMNVHKVGSRSVYYEGDLIGENFQYLDISKDYQGLKKVMSELKPDAIVHLAEIPSAPYSMMSPEHSSEVIRNNTCGTMNVLWAMREVCPDAHLIKLGTEGEYPDWLWDGKHIPEGHYMKVWREDVAEEFVDNKIPEFALDEDGNPSLTEWEIPVPRNFGSVYHSTKFYESFLIEYFCRVWGLTATDVNQGVVYGHRYGTRLDVDEAFGTVINRFVAQAVIGIPLTVYGKGGQKRGFINLQNSIEAIELLAKNPPEKGEFRVIHQTTQEYRVKEIAEKIQALTGCEIQYIDNPRMEMDRNYFTFDTSTLDNLGLKEVSLDEELPRLIEVMKQNKHRIIKEAIMPRTNWR